MNPQRSLPSFCNSAHLYSWESLTSTIDQYGGLHFAESDFEGLGIEMAPAGEPVSWQLRMTRPRVGYLEEDH